MTLFCAEKSLWFVGKITIFVTPKNEQNQNDMAENKKIKTALVSVYHKDGLDEIINKLRPVVHNRLSSRWGYLAAVSKVSPVIPLFWAVV